MIHWMNWRVVIALAVVAGFALAHLVDWCSRHYRSPLEWLANRQAWRDLRARGLACIREVPSRQSRRRQQREYVHALATRATAEQPGTPRTQRRAAERSLVKRYRNVGKQSAQQ